MKLIGAMVVKFTVVNRQLLRRNLGFVARIFIWISAISVNKIKLTSWVF